MTSSKGNMHNQTHRTLHRSHCFMHTASWTLDFCLVATGIGFASKPPHVTVTLRLILLMKREKIVLFGICGWPCEESGGGTKVYGQCFKQKYQGFHVRRPKALVPSQFSLHRGDNVWEKLSVEQKNGGQLEVQMPKSLPHIQLVHTPILLAWVPHST